MTGEQSVSELLKLNTISGVVLDNRSSRLALVSSRLYHEKKKPTESSIIVYSLDNNSILMRLEDKDTRKTNPVFDPTGTKMAFFEKIEDESHLVIQGLANNFTEKIKLDGEPQSMLWHGGSILLIMSEPVDRDLKKRHDDGFDGAYFEDEDRFFSLYLYTPGSGFRQLTSGIQVWEFASLDKHAVLVASDKPQEASWFHSRLYSLDLETLKLTELYNPGWRAIAKPRISADGTKVAFLESLWSDRGVVSGDILVYDSNGGICRNITEGKERSYADYSWNDEGALSALWLREGTSGISVYTPDSWKDVWQRQGSVLPSFSPEMSSSGGKYALVFTDDAVPQEAYLVDGSGNMKKVSALNEEISHLASYPAQVVRWSSEDGLEIHGYLRTLGPDKPLVVYIHGGPTSYSPVTFMDRSTMYLANGFSVFAPNYRGSIGAGRKYAEANRGDMGGMDFRDIMAGIEFLRVSGKLTTDNVFITGGSYGGFITAWAVTQTDKFRAAVGLFGIADWLSFHGTTYAPDWDRIHYNDDPYTGKLFQKFSPLNYVSNVKTPILLMHGMNDPSVPVSQFHQFYRALKDQGKEVRFLLFPREGHGFSEKNHIGQSIEESIKWFRKYVR